MSSSADKPVRHILTISGGKPAPCVRALDIPGSILTRRCPKPIVGGSMWHNFSLADLHTFSKTGSRPSSRRRRCQNWRFASLFMCIPQWVNYDKTHEIDCDRV